MNPTLDPLKCLEHATGELPRTPLLGTWVNRRGGAGLLPEEHYLRRTRPRAAIPPPTRSASGARPSASGEPPVSGSVVAEAVEPAVAVAVAVSSSAPSAVAVHHPAEHFSSGV